MKKILFNLLCTSAALFLTACSGSTNSGKGSGEACTASSECASKACVRASGGAVCGPVSTACMPACGAAQACVAVGASAQCLDLQDPPTSGTTGMGGSTGDGQGGETGMGGASDAGVPTGMGGSTASGQGGSSGSTEPEGEPAVCDAVLACFDTCAQGDQMCLQNCVQSTGASGQAYVAWIQCADGNGCFSLDGNLDFGCAFDACGTELEACFGFEVPNGNLSCSEFVACLGDCGQGDEACGDNCVNSTSALGFGQYNAFAICADQNGCFDIMDQNQRGQCLETNCGEEVTACFGEAAMPMGTNNCEAFFNCLVACPQNDAACQNGCVEGASQEGYDAFGAFQQCLQGALDPATGGPCQTNECIAAACPQETMACFPNGLPEPEGTGGTAGDAGAGGAAGEPGGG